MAIHSGWEHESVSILTEIATETFQRGVNVTKNRQHLSVYFRIIRRSARFSLDKAIPDLHHLILELSGIHDAHQLHVRT